MANERKKLAFAKKIQAQKAQGNSQKAQNLTYRYRAKVAARNAAAGDTSAAIASNQAAAASGNTAGITPTPQAGSQFNTGRLDLNRIRAGLKKYQGASDRARKKTLKASRRLNNTPAPGTPGGTY